MKHITIKRKTFVYKGLKMKKDNDWTKNYKGYNHIKNQVGNYINYYEE